MTGIELIAKERQEQIEKHGKTAAYDESHNQDRALVKAAIALLQEHPSIIDFPESWLVNTLTHKMRNKSYGERLVIAGALIAAEIDRITHNQLKQTT